MTVHVRALVADAGVRVTGEPALAGRVLAELNALRSSRPATELSEWIEVEIVDRAPSATGRHVLAQPPVDISLDDADVPTVSADGVSARIAERVELHVARDADQRMLRAVLDATWPLTLPRFGRLHVHGGAVRDPEGRGWLLANDAGAGKSTTVLSLALSGWGWTSDDATYVSRQGDALVAEGWLEPPRLSARSAAALRLSREDQASVFKTAVALPPSVTAARLPGIALHRLVLPEIGGVTHIDRVEPRRALDTLLRASAWLVCLPRMAESYLALLAQVAELPAWRLQLGPELLDAPESVARLLAELGT